VYLAVLHVGIHPIAAQMFRTRGGGSFGVRRMACGSGCEVDGVGGELAVNLPGRRWRVGGSC
jgi:hypothetical protein